MKYTEAEAAIVDPSQATSIVVRVFCSGIRHLYQGDNLSLIISFIIVFTSDTSVASLVARSRSISYNEVISHALESIILREAFTGPRNIPLRMKL